MGAFEALVSVVTGIIVTGRASMIERQEYEERLLAFQPDIFQEGSCTVCLDDWKEGEEEYRNRLGCYLEYAGHANKLDMRISWTCSSRTCASQGRSHLGV